MADSKLFKELANDVWEMPKTGRMRVPTRIVASREILQQMDEGVVEQITNVATLPGIVDAAWCMPDGHWGYGFPIGGVAAFDPKQDGVISPGGIGFDINCGVRMMTTSLTGDEVSPRLTPLLNEISKRVPAGVGRKGTTNLNRRTFERLMREGAGWAVDNGLGRPEDLDATEASGVLPGADPGAVSDHAVKRGIDQLGTLGSGNHYLEIQIVDQVFDEEAARVFGITGVGQVTVMIHCGSRGFGHQIATDYLKTFTREVMPRYGLVTPDRELACAPADSDEGRRYFSAMACAANNAFANRQVIMHRVREAFAEVFGESVSSDLNLLYDVAHNIAKWEEHEVDGRMKRLLVHRKGATRAFPPGHEEVPEKYRAVGQPVLVGGSMETGSYVLVGCPGAMTGPFGSTCHGAGRTMSRKKAKQTMHGRDLMQRMKDAGIEVRAASLAGLAEEGGYAYKDIDSVVRAVDGAGLSRPVARVRPIGNIKG